ncbi:2-dehydropantoate 2-reductase [Pandoraea nosoerga]|uniref:2-dehydropantoate 2-reductase n=1 Tax=Pandoraea nosoerga TaxID=2508296 RepID=A0A5E4Y2R2_9BURK|nr:2-dehydropantoate 2-reductase [Pandoraea nosoerga]MBN4667940.1 2-dehydropantoate 2-reductase [Pandoraea nosoerga]MBN4677812.1 2-dehydropantoate 2-reductase [Pandoraea nosoerga]MBN4682951.1 2-dehydropantoate 2-reductase [Pandoraea nosoerga]MBN4746966.1 2-dehydropantoate 2-reductase [Pandoraea nosoerga]VVE42585.1 2-dehydropantoate 2-reductase [Pandoraea nosoerga]
MKVTIIGAGAIGGLIGTRLAATGEAQVSALARGATLAALRERGWRVRQGEALIAAPVAAAHPVEEAGKLGVQDLVVIAVKGPALSQVAASVTPLLGPQTIVLPAMNGVPWWFCKGVAPFGDAPLASVDPDGAIGAAIAQANVLGCVVHASATTPEPGLVDHRMGRGLIVGEPAGGMSERVQRLAALLERAGFEAKASENVRLDIWYKLWGNLTMNPVSAITGATIDRLLDDPLVREFCSAAMREAAAIGARIGCAIDQSPEDRHAVTAKLGAFKTSMLQDVEAHRPIELDALVSVVREIGQRVQVPTPNIDALLGLARLFGRVHGLY